MEYHNFQITLTKGDSPGKYRAIVDYPVGACQEEFSIPFGKNELRNILENNNLLVRSTSETTSPQALHNLSHVSKTDDLDDIGTKISEALFCGSVRDAFAVTIGSLSRERRSGQRSGLRIRIRVDPNMPEYIELMSLPWEFLWDFYKRKRFELQQSRVIVRTPIVPGCAAPLRTKTPLRILVAISDPKNYPELKLGEELRSFKQISEVDDIEVDVLQHAKIEDVSERMGQHDYHVFHFMGHGGITEKGTALIFTNNNGKDNPVNGEDLSYALSDSIRLVVLNACETARIPENDPFTAIPTELLRREIPAVVAMQFPISDDAAIVFCKKFYEDLAKGNPVDQCMGEARRVVYFRQDIRAEWGTPVLFLNSPDGRLFQTEDTTIRS